MTDTKPIRIRESTKKKLDSLFSKKGDTYDKIIDRLATDEIRFRNAK